jgi:uncharacterized membrane protein
MFRHYHWLVLGPLAALSACAGTDNPLRRAGSYHALGHEPGWLLTVERKRLRFVTSSPATNLEVPRPIPQISPLGRRYSSDRLTIDIASQPCNDIRNGMAFSDTVLVTAGGYNYRGCGGDRVPLLDR